MIHVFRPYDNLGLHKFLLINALNNNYCFYVGIKEFTQWFSNVYHVESLLELGRNNAWFKIGEVEFKEQLREKFPEYFI